MNPELSVLLVDDEPAIAEAIIMFLEAGGCNVRYEETADSGIAALETDGTSIDVVVTDGLHGEYKRVIAAAETCGAFAVLFSNSHQLLDEARQASLPAVEKHEINLLERTIVEGAAAA